MFCHIVRKRTDHVVHVVMYDGRQRETGDTVTPASALRRHVRDVIQPVCGDLSIQGDFVDLTFVHDLCRHIMGGKDDILINWHFI